MIITILTEVITALCVMLARTANPLKNLYFLIRQTLNNNLGEFAIPDDVLRDLARILLPHILTMYQSEEGRKQLEEWKKEQDASSASLANKKSEGN